MICCLNPDCSNAENPDESKFCLSCGTELVALLRSRYRVIKPLGGGGFGRTYLTEDIDKLNELCVVKQLAPQMQGSWSLKKATELFEQEAKHLQDLGEHPQIPTLYAYFKENNYFYLVQQFVNGQNLLQELQEYGIFDEGKIRVLLRDLLSVLRIVHQMQVIHRDIKPDNILRRQSDSKLVLIDFGVSKEKTGTISPKQGTNIGSFGYAALEQMQGGQAYYASDLYSLGVTCFHLMTNVSPWDLWMQQGYGWTLNWQSHLTQPISNNLVLIMNKLLEQNYKERYQSIDEVLQDLNKDQFLPTPGPQQSPSTLPQLSAQELLIWSAVTGASGSFIAIALVSFAVTIWMSSGLWLLLLGGLIFTQHRALFDKTYLFIIAVITSILTILLLQILPIKNPMQAGVNGLLVIVLLVIFAGLLAFSLMAISQLMNKFISQSKFLNFFK